MKLGIANFKILKAWAKNFFGGYRQTFEVQTWNGKVDITDLPEDEMDEADVNHFDLTPNTDLPETGILDIHVHGWAKRNDPDRCGEKLGCFDLTIEDGKPTAVRLSSDRPWYNWDRSNIEGP